MVETAAGAGIPAPALQVIGAGLGRTGTLSLRQALVRLGFGPCDHMLENLEHPERFALWAAALRRKDAGEPIDWRPLLTGFRAIVDWPGAYFWEELATAHPEALVILTVRDQDRWYDSILQTIFAMAAAARPEAGLEVPIEIIRDRTFGARLGDRAHCQAVFGAHNRAVREGIAPDRLLVFDVTTGWEPLCAFLGVPVPDDEPFPHANATAAFKTGIQEHFL
jgi:hypothetical protein